MNAIRLIRLALVVASAGEAAGCSKAKPSLEVDLATVALSHENGPKKSLQLSDGSVLLAPGTEELKQARIRLMERGPAGIPELLRLAESNPRLTGAGLAAIADLLLVHHEGPFQIDHPGRAGEYWVARTRNGEGISRTDPREVNADREAALDTFRKWLARNGYLR